MMYEQQHVALPKSLASTRIPPTLFSICALCSLISILKQVYIDIRNECKSISDQLFQMSMKKETYFGRNLQ